jgi:hypothetical protein
MGLLYLTLQKKLTAAKTVDTRKFITRLTEKETVDNM